MQSVSKKHQSILTCNNIMKEYSIQSYYFKNRHFSFRRKTIEHILMKIHLCVGKSRKSLGREISVYFFAVVCCWLLVVLCYADIEINNRKKITVLSLSIVTYILFLYHRENCWKFLTSKNSIFFCFVLIFWYSTQICQSNFLLESAEKKYECIGMGNICYE